MMTKGTEAGMYGIRSKKGLVTAVALTAAILSGCGGGQPAGTDKSGDASTGPPELTKEPITLKMYQSNANIADEEFKQMIADPVKKKYPNITMELVRNGPQQTPKELVVSGTFPDMMFLDNRYMSQFLELDLGTDIREMAKRSNLDLNKFDPITMEALKFYGAKGELYALPFSINFAANWYNKDIFDKFAVPYPKDLMTWEELIELGKRVSRSEGGIQIRAVDPNSLPNFGTVMLNPMIDAKTGQATLTTNEWQRRAELYVSINRDIPGNRRDQNKNGKDAFFKDRNMAMLLDYGGRIGDIDQMYKEGVKFNWDVASYPIFKDFPTKGWEVNAHVIGISSTTKYKNEAFAVMMLLTDQAQQLFMTKQGRLSSINDPEMKKSFGMDMKSLRGKNVQGIFKVSHTPSVYRTTNDSLAQSQLVAGIDRVIKGETDVNTALREANEKANKAIADAAK